MRLENQKTLSQMAHDGGDGAELVPNKSCGKAGDVELTKGGLIEKLLSCTDIYARTASVGSGDGAG